MDDCDEVEIGGEMRTKRLLVKKVVPVCEKPVCLSSEPATIGSPLPRPRISVYPMRP